MLDNNKSLQFSLILISLALPVSLYAQSSYLFPSDITDQSEQEQHDIERAQRYESQRKWVYPDEQDISQQEQYSSPKNDQNYKTIEYPRSDHYKYDDFNDQQYPQRSEPVVSEQNSYHPSYQPSNKQGAHDFQAELRQSSYRSAEDTRSQVTHQPRYEQNQQRYQSPQNYAPDYEQSPYQQPGEANNGEQRHQSEQYYQDEPRKYQQQPREIYVSDLIKKPAGQAKRFFPEKNDIRHYGSRVSQALKPANALVDHSQDQVQTQIRYIPVPVYTYGMPPGTLPGTVPGVVTPPNMVPGYSHLSPSYNSYSVSPYTSPWGGMGTYPITNPYEFMNKTYGGNNGALIPYNPVNIMPGFSTNPNVFLK